MKYVTRTTLYERLRKRSYRRLGKGWNVYNWARGVDEYVYWDEVMHAAYLRGVRDAIRAVRLESSSPRVNVYKR